MLCTGRVNSVAVGNGDSGSPVYYPASASEPAYAMGILFAGADNNTDVNVQGEARCLGPQCHFWFSEWNQLQSHLNRYFSP